MGSCLQEEAGLRFQGLGVGGHISMTEKSIERLEAGVKLHKRHNPPEKLALGESPRSLHGRRTDKFVSICSERQKYVGTQ